MHSVDNNPYTEIQWIVQDVDQWAESQLQHCMQSSRQVCHQLVQEEVGAEMEELQNWMMQKWHQTKCTEGGGFLGLACQTSQSIEHVTLVSAGARQSSNSCSTGGTS